MHETTSEYTDDIIDFFEDTVSAVPSMAADHPALHGGSAAHESLAAAAFLDGRKSILPDMQRPNHRRMKALHD